MSTPSKENLKNALASAGQAHHEYETVILDGVRDKFWPGFYAAYTLGQIGDFIKPSVLTNLLEEAPLVEDWPENTANYILERI